MQDLNFGYHILFPYDQIMYKTKGTNGPKQAINK